MKALTPEHADGERARRAWDASQVAAMAQLACLLEASAPKPGNVSPGRHFADTRYEHFLASAAAIGGAFAGAGERPLGATIRFAIESTSQFTSANTNLGIVLLLTPLARAAFALLSPGSDPSDARRWGQTPMAPVTGTGPGARADSGADPAGNGIRGLTQLDTASGVGSVRSGDSTWLHAGDSWWQELRTSLAGALATTTVDDARDVYAAIRLASPGGLGEVDSADVADEPTITLLDAMKLAADRDGIAREYVTGFATTFEIGVPALARARHEGLSWDDAVVETYISLLASAPDTHIARRGGARLADDVTRRAVMVIRAGGVRTQDGRDALDEMDAALRSPANTANPGTTADLTAAAIFVFLLAGGWSAGSDRRQTT